MWPHQVLDIKGLQVRLPHAICWCFVTTEVWSLVWPFFKPCFAVHAPMEYELHCLDWYTDKLALFAYCQLADRILCLEDILPPFHIISSICCWIWLRIPLIFCCQHFALRRDRRSRPSKYGSLKPVLQHDHTDLQFDQPAYMHSGGLFCLYEDAQLTVAFSAIESYMCGVTIPQAVAPVS